MSGGRVAGRRARAGRPGPGVTTLPRPHRRSLMLGSCKDSTWRCRGVLVARKRGEDVSCGGESAAGGRGCEPVLGQDRADFADDVADGAPADLKQFGEGVLGAQFALVEHGGEDPFVVGDLLGEHASAGTGQAFPTAAAVAVSLVAGGLDVLDTFGPRGPL